MYVRGTGQALHCRINADHHNIVHGRTNESPIVAHFNSNTHLQADITVVVIDQLHSHNPCWRKNMQKLVAQDSGDLITIGNEPQSGQSVKLTRLFVDFHTCLFCQNVDYTVVGYN